jgi:hypothetical protein
MTHTWRLRAGPGALIVLAHLVFFAILLRYADTPPVRDKAGPADYIEFALVPAKAMPKKVEAAARVAVPREPKASLPQAAPAPSSPVAVPSVLEPQESIPEQAAPQGKQLDMDALRGDARRLAREHVAGPFEQVRDAEHRLAAEKKDLGRAIREAKRPPCTKKYSGGTSLNVFALIPLAIDTITDTGCKW